MASSAAPRALARPSTSRSLSFVDLPQEVQEEIIRHCSPRDLVCVSLVSKHFRDLAAAQLYREFVIVFPDEDNPQFDTPVDALAGGFDTFVTSDYNYAQYLRNLCFDTLYMGDKAEVAYRPYLANLSCGKFMNTLLLLTLRKARALEFFKWNIRVELSRPVYKELHRIDALSHVHIRLQSGPSQYEIPPPLPYSPSHTHSPPVLAHAAPITSIAPPPTFGGIPPPPPGFYISTSAPALPPLHVPKPPRPRAPKKAHAANEPPTLSGFRKLKSLAVLDIETLDLVPELQACVRNSAGTLTKLKLSLSEKLASTARKPAIDPDPEDSDPDDELMPMPVSSQSHAQNEEMSGPARAFRAQEERKSQESVLGRIFDVESIPVERPQVTGADKKEKKKKSKAKSDQDVVDLMKTITSKVLEKLNDTSDFTPPQEVLDMIGQAAQKYLDEAKARKEKEADKPTTTRGSSSEASGSESSGVKTEAGSTEPSEPVGSLFSDTPAPKKTKDEPRDANPDDIDIEEPEEQLAIDPEDPPAIDAPAPEPTSPQTEAAASTAAPLASTKDAECDNALATLQAHRTEYQALTGELDMFEAQANALTREIRRLQTANPSVDISTLTEAEARLRSFTSSVRDMQKEINVCEAAIDYVETLRPDLAAKDGKAASSPPGSKDAAAPARATTAARDDMRDYLRETRGVALASLSVYLIPVKASVLSRAVDLRVLRRLTLLNVGIQAPIWALLHRENRESPLPLRKIFTDNVSHVFLNFVAGLPELHELFLLEREPKARPESFAPRTQVTVDQIRRLALRRHLPTLRRVMIKNLADMSWDVNTKTVLLLCRLGRNLEELACNMSIRAMHCLMQHISGLASLRALHVVHLRNDDTCVWVMRETKRFLIDNVSHHPALPLRWIAIDEDDRADQLVRVADLPRSRKKEEEEGEDGAATKKGKDSKGKGKGKSALSADAGGGFMLPMGGGGMSSSSNMDVNAPFTALAEGALEVDVQGLIDAAELEFGGDDAHTTTGGGGMDIGGSDDSDSEDEDGSGGRDELLGQKIETVEGIPFCDVEGVRIFKKEIVAGRL